MHTRNQTETTLPLFPLLATFLIFAATLSGPVHPNPGVAEADALPFLLQSTNVRVIVTGPVAHAVVTQAWQNPNPFPVDGLYIFPLPEDAAVTDMSLRIGERWIHGEMHRREQARAIYEQARSQGRVAGLLEQDRPNIFAQQVANIMPGKQIDVVISFDHPVTCEDGSCEYVFPTVVGPRFIPTYQTDPGKIDPPVVEEGSSTGQSLSLELDLDAGVTLYGLESPSHRVNISRHNDSRARVTLSEGADTKLDRDFRLRWRLGGEAPDLGLLAWRDPRQEKEPGVFSLILQPPQAPAGEQIAPRELVFVLDCSGSMSGVPIEAAKNVVRKALEALRPQDTFQIIRFSESASRLGPKPLRSTPANIHRALRYLASLQGQGGTHMIEGIRAALGYPDDPQRLRIVAFLTDGYIGNERQILAEVQKRIGIARIFTFGIGSSVNRYLLESLAEEGRGTAAFLAPRESPDELVERFVKRIDAPVLTDIRITWEDLEVRDLEPARMPDLFAGQPLILHGRYAEPGTGVVHVEGRRKGHIETFSQVVSFPHEASDHEALGRLWARARIHRLEREQHQGERHDVREAITKLGLRHRLMTAYTSLVAVDSEISNTSGSSAQVSVPVEMPQDVSYEGVFGREMAKHRVLSTFQQRASASIPAQEGFHQGLPIVGRNYLSVLTLAPGLTDTDGDGAPNVKGARSVPFAAPDARKETARQKDETRADSLPFDQVTLWHADGTRIVVEADGEVWRIEARTRTLMRTLTATEMETLRHALSQTHPPSWSGSESGTRLVIESARGRHVAALPASDPAVDVLVRLIEHLAS